MTREFNNQRRDDMRPSSHQGNQSSFQRNGEERSPRPARPRLSREIVDRAWENGAQPRHADYHPRNNGQPSANNRRNTQQSEYSSYQNGTGGNRTHGYRKNSYDDSPAQQRGNHRFNESQRGSHPRSSGSDRRNYDEPRSQEYRTYNQHDRQFGPRNESDDRRGPRGYNTPQRPYPSRERYDGRGNGYHRGPDRRPPHTEQFEGDYERFAYDSTKAPHGKERHTTDHTYQDRNNTDKAPHHIEPEKHVTRLPDGRVLKGSRPEQRKKAQFWTEVAQDTNELIQQIKHDPVLNADATTEDTNLQEDTTPIEVPTQPDTRPATVKKNHARAAKESTIKPEAKTKKPRTHGPKPSQRGFKWPTP